LGEDFRRSVIALVTTTVAPFFAKRPGRGPGLLSRITTDHCFCAAPLTVVPCSLSSTIHFMVLSWPVHFHSSCRSKFGTRPTGPLFPCATNRRSGSRRPVLCQRACLCDCRFGVLHSDCRCSSN